ncbi:flavin-containing monooxygenase [Paenibacillus sp. JSM ZJ436]|uniref:flavin-containing monooxygenase n=1 Tax=Paenibacillus sp. JSM ZJ436 TaxID=3376190 RepID=UPI00379E8771
MNTHVDILIIGAGQAGLAAAYHLSKTTINFLLIGQESRIGDPWRQRYDSLITFTPRAYNALPGLLLEGNPDGCSSKDEIADSLEQYARHYSFPMQLGVKVQRLERTAAGFAVTTSQGEIQARQVIVATGPFQKPHLPPFAQQLSENIRQMHTSEYVNPSSLQQGYVLIVGAGNSGAQIAAELSMEREVHLSAGQRLKFMPLTFWGKSMFWWLKHSGVLRASADSPAGRWLRAKGDPIFGTEVKRALRSDAVTIKPRTVAAKQDVMLFEDGTQAVYPNIIWATGFRPDYGWIKVPGVLDGEGRPLHQRGISSVQGLFFLGLPWQQRRDSALLGGVGRDAEYIVQWIRKSRRG